MTVYLSEDEQIEAIKKWWARFGNAILTVIIIAMMGVLASQWWARRENNIAQSASTAYEQLLASVATHDEMTARISAESIIERFPGTTYADISQLMLARFDVEKSDFDKAQQHLNFVINNGKTKAIQQIARIRSAQIDLNQKKADEALKVLETVNDPSFQALISEARGDSYVALGDASKAKTAYQEAYKLIPPNTGAERLLQLKMNNIPGVSA